MKKIELCPKKRSIITLLMKLCRLILTNSEKPVVSFKPQISNAVTEHFLTVAISQNQKIIDFIERKIYQEKNLKRKLQIK